MRSGVPQEPGGNPTNHPTQNPTDTPQQGEWDYDKTPGHQTERPVTDSDHGATNVLDADEIAREGIQTSVYLLPMRVHVQTNP